MLSGGGGFNRADSAVNSALIIRKTDERKDTRRAVATWTPIGSVYPQNPFGDVNLMCPLCMVVTLTGFTQI